MKIKASKIALLTDSNGDTLLQLTTKDNRARMGYDELKDLTELSVEIKKYRHKRSLDQNGYLWVLIHEIASVINTDKDSVYLKALKRYGVYQQAIIKKDALERFKRQWKLVEVLDEKQQQNVEMVKVLCYYGSSTYDTKEMTTLLDGVISDAKELGIETMTPKELAQMRAYEEKEKK